jgi:hypothetical protein
MKLLLIFVALFIAIDSQAACNNKSLIGQYYYDYNIPVNGVNYYNNGIMTFDGRSDYVRVPGVYGAVNTGFGKITYSGQEAGIPTTATGFYALNANCVLEIDMQMIPVGYTKHHEWAWSTYGVMSGNTVLSGGGTVYIYFLKGDKLYPTGGSFSGPFSLRKK